MVTALLFNATFRVLRAGTTVVTITASDADDQTYGNSAKLVYSILQGQPYFSVDSENGEPNSTGRTALFPPERQQEVSVLKRAGTFKSMFSARDNK